MRQFFVEPAVLNSKAEVLFRCARVLSDQKDVLESVLHDDFASGSAYDTVMERLRGISERITVGQTLFLSHYSALLSVADKYSQTEKSILGSASGQHNGSILKDRRSWRDEDEGDDWDDDGIDWFKEDALINLVAELRDLELISDQALAKLVLAIRAGDTDACMDVVNELIKDLVAEGKADALACVPRYLSNEGFIAIYEALRTGDANGNEIVEKLLDYYGNTVTTGESFSHFLSNRIMLSAVYKPGTFIENQYEWGDILYGKDTDYPIVGNITNTSNMAQSGCEVIAVANALTNLGNKLSYDDMARLIFDFEGDGMALNGVIGTSPMALYEYMMDKGYDAAYITSTDATDINNFGKDYRTFIVTGYNDSNDLSHMVHTVCITKNPDGTFTIHNSGSWSDAKPYTYPTLDDVMQYISYYSGGNSEPIMITGVRNK